MINFTKNFYKQFSTLSKQQQKQFVYQLKNLNEHQYQQNLDKNFSYFPSSSELHQMEENLIQDVYKNMVLYLTQKTQREREQFLKKNNMQVDVDLISKIEEQLKQLNDQGYKIEVDEQGNQFNIKHLGHLHIKGLDIEKNNNLFIHQYKYNRIDNEIKFEEKKSIDQKDESEMTEEEKLKKLKLEDINMAKNQKKQKMQEELRESFKEHQDSAVRQKLKDVFGKFGYNYGENDKQLFEAPEIKESLHSVQQNLFQQVNTAGSYIMVEDFLVQSNLGLKIKSKNNNNNKQEVLQEEKAQISEGQTELFDQKLDNSLQFTHFLRTAYVVQGKQAPSVKNTNVRTIMDLDASLYGNPPCKVKIF